MLYKLISLYSFAQGTQTPTPQTETDPPKQPDGEAAVSAPLESDQVPAAEASKQNLDPPAEATDVNPPNSENSPQIDFDPPVEAATDEIKRKKMTKKTLIIAVSVVVGLALIAGGILFYLHNRYHGWITYTTSQEHNILFIGGEQARLSALSDAPLFNQDVLYLLPTYDSLMSIAHYSPRDWDISAMETGSTHISLRSEFTEERHDETWHMLAFLEADPIHIWRGETGEFFPYLDSANLLDYTFDGDLTAMYKHLASRLDFETSDERIVSVCPESGVLSAIGRGDATVTIRQGAYIVGSYDVAVRINIERLEVEEDTVTMERGETHQLQVRIYPSDADVEVTYVAEEIDVSAEGLITAPPYACYEIDRTFTILVQAGDLAAPVYAHVNNSYRLTWGEHSDRLLTSGNVVFSAAPMEFVNPVPNATGFRVRYIVSSVLWGGGHNIGLDNLEREWRVFVRAEEIGWRNVGTVLVNSADVFYYADITFSERTLTQIIVLPPAAAAGRQGSWSGFLEIINLEYNGAVH